MKKFAELVMSNNGRVNWFVVRRKIAAESGIGPQLMAMRSILRRLNGSKQLSRIRYRRGALDGSRLVAHRKFERMKSGVNDA